MPDLEKVKANEQESAEAPAQAEESGAVDAVEEGGAQASSVSLGKGDEAPKVALDKGAEIILEGDKPAEDEPEAEEDEPRFKKREFVPWPVDPDHSSAQEMLMQGEQVNLDEVIEDQKLEAGGNGMNFFLMLLVIAAGVGGVYQLRIVSDPAILEAKRAAAKEEEQAHIEEQLKLKKTYGVINIDSLPQQAAIAKREIEEIGNVPDFKRIQSKNKEGVTVSAITPLIMKDVDVDKLYEFKLEAEGYLPYTFYISRHIWTKEGNDFKFVKTVDMTAMACEHWFLYDSAKKEEQQFPTKPECNTYYKKARSENVTVTDCTCKELPEGVEPGDKKDDDKKKKK